MAKLSPESAGVSRFDERTDQSKRRVGAIRCGADDGNRTRVFSLGIFYARTGVREPWVGLHAEATTNSCSGGAHLPFDVGAAAVQSAGEAIVPLVPEAVHGFRLSVSPGHGEMTVKLSSNCSRHVAHRGVSGRASAQMPASRSASHAVRAHWSSDGCRALLKLGWIGGRQDTEVVSWLPLRGIGFGSGQPVSGHRYWTIAVDRTDRQNRIDERRRDVARPAVTLAMTFPSCSWRSPAWHHPTTSQQTTIGCVSRGATVKRRSKKAG